jgi:glycosyltransferase involved in cell wall biosynthesis
MKDSRLLKKLFWYLFQKQCFKKADLIHAISENEYQDLIKIFPDFKKKIVLIPNGLYAPDSFVDIDFEFKSMIDSFINEDSFIYLFLSRINKKKGLDLLVPAFNKLLLDFPNIQLIIAGPEGDFSEELTHIISGKSNILLLPSCIEWSKNYLFEKSDIFVLPSYSEGFSIAALEAISYGKPSIFSNFIGFSNDVIDFNAGLISDNTVLSLYDKMKKIQINSNLRKELSLNSLKLFNDKFRMDLIGDLFLNKINSLLHG